MFVVCKDEFMELVTEEPDTAAAVVDSMEGNVALSVLCLFGVHIQILQ